MWGYTYSKMHSMVVFSAHFTWMGHMNSHSGNANSVRVWFADMRFSAQELHLANQCTMRVYSLCVIEIKCNFDEEYRLDFRWNLSNCPKCGSAWLGAIIRNECIHREDSMYVSYVIYWSLQRSWLCKVGQKWSIIFRITSHIYAPSRRSTLDCQCQSWVGLNQISHIEY